MDDEREVQVLKRSRHPVVFVNHVDTYVGKNISKVNAKTKGLCSPIIVTDSTSKLFIQTDFMLNVIQVFASSIVGANSDAVDNDSQASDQTEGAKKDNYYKVVGTIFDPEKNEKPAWVHEGFKVYHMQCPADTCKLLATNTVNTRKNLTTCTKSANKLSKVVFAQLVSRCQQVWSNLLSTGNKGKHLCSTCHEKCLFDVCGCVGCFDVLSVAA